MKVSSVNKPIKKSKGLEINYSIYWGAFIDKVDARKNKQDIQRFDMNIFSNKYPVRDESSVEKNDAACTSHSVRNADKLNDVASLTGCSGRSVRTFPTELPSLTGCQKLLYAFYFAFLKNIFQKSISKHSEIMNRKSKIIRKLRLTTVGCAMLLLSSCLKEDMKNCPEQIRVYFDVSTPARGTKIEPEDVDRMNLFVFNHKGYYLCEYRDERIIGFTPEEYYIDCSDLLPGKYHFIAWAGKDEQFYTIEPDTFERGKTRFEDALLMLEYRNNVVSQETEPIHHLFHSELPATVTNEKVQRFTMPLKQQTNTINIRTELLPATADVFSFNIIDNNSDYTFEGAFANAVSDKTFTYTAPCTKDGADQLRSTLNVMRLSAERRTPKLQILNKTTGKLLYPHGIYSGDLVDLILKANPENDFDATHIYDIVLRFENGFEPEDPANISITIEINGWVVRGQDDNLVE